MPNRTGAAIKHIASVFVLGFIILYILISVSPLEDYVGTSAVSRKPDFSRYIHSDTLQGPADQGRLIIVGDIHAQYSYFQDLLSRLQYDSSLPPNDILVHTGDIMAKGALSDSLLVLDWMTSRNVSGVRGNHDQKVIEWKSWRDWARAHKEGKLWLDQLDRLWEEQRDEGGPKLDADQWVEQQKKKSRNYHKWWNAVPKGWKMFQDHYLIASSMQPAHFDYLLSLPLILHLPFYHSFIAHAGLLPSDPTRSPTASNQPLAHLPDPPMTDQNDENKSRLWQEMALLKDIPQNNDPWIVLNMRSLLADHSVTRKGNKGKPWSPSWNSMMNRCSGYYGFQAAEEDVDSAPLPCLPSTVIYGHAASRGQDVKRWSFGLDSGCAYGRRLTALVLEAPGGANVRTRREEDEDVYDDANASVYRRRKVRFGDAGGPDGYVVDIRC